MWTPFRTGLGLVLFAIGVGAVGCSLSGANSSSENAVTGASFNKNHLLDDDVLMDDRALTAQQIQNLLDRPPSGHPSPLAAYRDGNGIAASTILHDTAVAFGINPIELLVRAEMENGLVGGATSTASSAAAPTTDAGASDDGATGTDDDGSASTDDDAAPPPDDDAAPPPPPDDDAGAPPDDAGTSADDAGSGTGADPAVLQKIQQAFNCGGVKSLEAQAGCAAKSLARNMKLLLGGQPASGGFQVGVTTKTQDNISVKPDNAATAALYVYTPYVGETGGGARNTAGVSGHQTIWNQFAKALKYTGPACSNVANSEAGTCGECSAGNTSACSADGKGSACLSSHACGCTKDSDCGDTGSGRACNLQTSSCETAVDTGDAGDPGDPDASSAGDADPGDAGAPQDAGKPKPDAGKPKPPSGSGGGGGPSGPGDSIPGGQDDGAGHSTPGGSTFGPANPESDDGGTGGAKKGGGCSSTGGAPGDLGGAALLLGAVALATRRRRRTENE